MNTPAHVIFSLALLGRPNAARYAIAIAVGAVLPDIFMVLFYIYEKILGVPETVIWNQHYFLPFWQNLFDTANSIPLILITLFIALYYKSYSLCFLFASMAVHCLLDLPVHHDDGHRHFFPFSEFRFASPISYWDPSFHGNIVGLIELLLFFVVGFWLWRWESASGLSYWKITRLRSVISSFTIIYLLFFGFVAITWLDW